MSRVKTTTRTARHWAARRRAVRASCDGGRHYFVKVGGTWTCTICGETQ